MKKKLIYVIFIILILIIPLNIFAQSNQQLIDEQKKEQLKKKLAELNQKELLELERQVDLKEQEIKALQDANTILENKVNKTEQEKSFSSVQPSDQRNNESSTNVNGVQTTRSPVSNVSFVKQAKASTTENTNPVSFKPTTERTDSTANLRRITIDCETSPIRASRLDKQICHWAKDAVEQFNIPGNTFPLAIDIKRADLTATVFLGALIKSGKFSDAVAKKFLIEAEDSRIDKQVGADSNGSGTTSLVVKGGVPAFLNWAVENGAASATNSGTSTTFRINPVGFFETLTGRSPVTIEPSYKPDPFIKNLKRTSIGFTFDISRGSTPNVFTGSREQLSAVSFRYEFINERNGYKDALRAFFDGDAPIDYARSQAATFKSLFTNSDNRGNITVKNAEAQNWFNTLNGKLAVLGTTADFLNKSNDDKLLAVEAEIKIAIDTFPFDNVAKDSVFLQGLITYVSNAQAFVQATTNIEKAARRGQVFTFEYTNNRETATPDTSNFRLIYERNTYFGMDFTLNSSLTFYHKKPAGTDVKKIKDFNFATQLDVPLTGIESLRKGLLTFAFKYQRLMGDAVALDGTVLPNTKGDITVGQVKLMIPIFKGIRFPISATFANRTELVREKEVRGNFGFTFDIDTLLTMLRGQ